MNKKTENKILDIFCDKCGRKMVCVESNKPSFYDMGTGEPIYSQTYYCKNHFFTHTWPNP